MIELFVSGLLILSVVLTVTVAGILLLVSNLITALAFVTSSIVAFFANSDISIVLDIAALAAIFGAFLAYNRIKTALVASEAAGKAWHEECEAAKMRAERLKEKLSESEKDRLAMVAKVTALEQRPDLGKLEAAISYMADAATAQIGALTDATLKHEQNAEVRSMRIVDAIHELVSAT